jgi:calpain-7
MATRSSGDLLELGDQTESHRNRVGQPKTRDEALEIAIADAEAAMRALKVAKDPNEKAKQSTRFKQLLQEAERIKHSKDWRAVPLASSTSKPESPTQQVAPAMRNLKEPVSSRIAPRSEQILLLKAGYLNGFKFPPWKDPPAPDEFELKDGESLFEYVLTPSAFLSSTSS